MVQDEFVRHVNVTVFRAFLLTVVFKRNKTWCRGSLAGNGLSEVVSTSLHFSEERLGCGSLAPLPRGVEY